MRYLLSLLLFMATLGLHAAPKVVVGAAQPEQYLPLLEGKRVALFSNQTGIIVQPDGSHLMTLDLLLRHGVNVVTIFSPEHGFRGKADAGEHVASSVDEQTGVPIFSLYGADRKSVV